MPSFVFKLREIERIVEWFTVKSPESHLGHSHVARNLSHVARNFLVTSPEILVTSPEKKVKSPVSNKKGKRCSFPTTKCGVEKLYLGF